jgi:GT2 family glycosyltransferase
LSPNETYPQHVVTAVIVAHDGAAWLPRVIRALLDQTRPVQRVVAVDTGSRDRSGSVLAGLLGQGVVFGMDRGTGYGAAVARALQHRAANVNVSGSAGAPGGDRMEWVWLLHDDCEPAPDALEQLLRGAAETRSAAVLGPKVRDWGDRQVILEAGITIDTAGRRITGVEPREVDQGQHDGDRDSLAVSSAGMLVRRDVWDLVGGFEPAMALFREDLDFCWRVHAAGYRVRVITDAVVYHVEASARRRRPVSLARRPRRLDRRNAMLTLFGNLPALPMLLSAAGNLGVSLARALFFLLAKRVAAAMDELAAVGSVLGHPLRLMAMRRRRTRGRKAAYGRLRRDLPPGHSLRRIAEFAASALSKSGPADTAGSHHATDDPDEADFLLTDTGILQRVLTNPGVLLFLALTVISLVAERSLLSSRPLGGGALVPAWGGADGLWHQYLQGFHPVGIGSADSAPPYLAVIAALATVLGGKPWLAVDVILLGCVPLAGLCAFLGVRRVTSSTPVRVWAAASYALLPVAMGAIAAGRLGSAVAFVLVPAIALLAGRMLTQPPRRARRAAWATGLTVAVAAAFVPLVWLVVVVLAVGLAAARPAMWRNLSIVAIVPPVLLLPWTIQAASNPASLLLEAGLQQPGLAVRSLPAKSIMLLSPGGPGLPPVWVTAGIALAALAALLLSRRRGVMLAGWGVALAGLLVAVALSRVMVTPATGGPAVSAWPGVALLIAAIGLLLAGVTAGEALPRLAGRGGVPDRGRRPGKAGGRKAGGGPRTLRGTAAALLAVAACSAPALAAASWVTNGVRGPVGPVAGPVVPAVVSVSASSGLQLRTLVLRSDGSQVDYALQRGTTPSLGDPGLAPAPGPQRALSTAVAALVAPNGGEAVDQGQQLAGFDIGFVLLPAPVNEDLARLLNGVAGLRPVSATSAFDLWRVTAPAARVRVVEPNGSVVPLQSGPVGASTASVPAAGGTLELAEPTGGWTAALNGKPLTSVASPAGSWAQAFQLPAGGGTLSISHSQTGRDLMLALELLLTAVVAALALPGSRSAAEEAASAAGSRAVASPRQRGDASDGAAAPGGRRGGGRQGRAARGPKRDRDGSGGKRPRERAGRRPAAGVAAGAGAAAAGAGGAGVTRAGAAGAGAARAGGRAAARAGQRAAWPADERGGAAGGRIPRPADEPDPRGSWAPDEPDATAAWPSDERDPRGTGPSDERAARTAWPANERDPRGSWAPDEPDATAAWPSDERAAWSSGQHGSRDAWPSVQDGGQAAWPSQQAGPANSWQDQPGVDEAWPDEQGAGGAWQDEPGGRESWVADEPGPPGAWPSDAGQAGGARRSPSGSWPPPDETQRWQDEPDAWNAPQQPSGWQGGAGDTLDPLPPRGGSRHRRHAAPGDDDPAQWPVPERDAGGDAW